MSGSNFNSNDFEEYEDLLEQVEKEVRRQYIETAITRSIENKTERDLIQNRAEQIAQWYFVRDMSCMRLLALAAQKGRFEEFANLLEENYRAQKLYLTKAPNAKTTTKQNASILMDSVLSKLEDLLKNENKCE